MTVNLLNAPASWPRSRPAAMATTCSATSRRTYSVQFGPSGYLITTKDAASSTDANDSDADLVTGNTIQTVLESGESDLTWDAGLVQKARIGDYVWEDKDADGVQDAGETGIAGSRWS
ncbi:MAG: SdrD B-like domain-containing protein [Burkholderiales bacterium]